jgi:cytochrome P450
MEESMTELAGPPQRVIPDELVVADFDYFNLPGASRCPHGAIARLLDGPPIFHTPAHGGHWVAARGPLVEAILTDPETFSNSPVVLWSMNPQIGRRAIPEELDPPEHGPYRRVINRLMSMDRINGLTPYIEALSHDLIDRVLSAGECEFIGDVAKRLPVDLFLKLMELPAGDLDNFSAWVDDMLKSTDPAVRTAAHTKAEQYFAMLVRQRRGHEGQDGISFLCRSEIHGRMLDDDELVSMLVLLLQGGLDTTTNELGFVMRFLADNPGHRAVLAAEPDRIPRAIEEMMRQFGIVNSVRTVRRQVAIGGVTLYPGEQILVPHILYGLDQPDAIMAPPETFGRRPVRHFLFGNGTHQCPGAPLVRTELAIFLRLWLQRIPDFYITDGAPLSAFGGMIMGLNALPLTVVPAAEADGVSVR